LFAAPDADATSGDKDDEYKIQEELIWLIIHSIPAPCADRTDGAPSLHHTQSALASKWQRQRIAAVSDAAQQANANL
jgi:hypothetical protein